MLKQMVYCQALEQQEQPLYLDYRLEHLQLFNSMFPLAASL
jgi:hypothetical protein